MLVERLLFFLGEAVSVVPCVCSGDPPSSSTLSRFFSDYRKPSEARLRPCDTELILPSTIVLSARLSSVAVSFVAV